jgi:hypothetical protein
MKATIDIPDELYRQVKAKSALRGQAVRAVAVSLFQGWIAETEAAVPTPPAGAERLLPAWFGAARKYARKVSRHDMTAVRRSIAQGRANESGTAAAQTECP